MLNTVDFFLNISNTLQLYRIDDSTCKHIKKFSKEGKKLIPMFLEEIEEWLISNPVFKMIYETETGLKNFLARKKIYWDEFFRADLDKNYFESRMKMGRYYSDINLSLNACCALISYKLSWWSRAAESSKTQSDHHVVAEAIRRHILLDYGATCVAYTELNNELLENQSHALLQLSTPTIQLWEGILLLPIVGVLDSVRAQNMMEEMLKKIVHTSSAISIIDIAGVPNVDSSVANHLIKIVRSAKLLGNTCILSGVSPEVAQTLVEIGVELEGINTTSTLRNALRFGLDKFNMTIADKATLS